MISVVIPIYNEEQTLPLLFSKLGEVIPTLGDVVEVVLVDDGSSDRSLALMNGQVQKDRRYRVIKLSRNFGHQAAFSAGIKYAKGDALILMDGDLQDPPEVLAQFVEKWKEGFHVVYAVRTGRQEGIFKRMSYAVFYRILSFLSDIEIPLDSGDFCLLDRKVVDALNQDLPEQIRFVRGLRAFVGFRQVGIPCPRHARAAGEPKYSLAKLTGLALDGLFGFSLFPLRLAAYCGFLIAIPSFVMGLFFIVHRLFNFPVFGHYASETPGLASLAVGLFFLGGVLLIILGIIGEYVGRIYIEVKRRPTYIVEKVISAI